jgi:hypothetical protein
VHSDDPDNVSGLLHKVCMLIRVCNKAKHYFLYTERQITKSLAGGFS